ncbi:MAG TPA: hypothetical protein VGW74_09455 [Propionibacteriaceae bacterium]|nr:hypothetical protein [Propionibacteriaceae bacterium]
MARDPQPKVRLVSKAQDRINAAWAPHPQKQQAEFNRKAADAAAATAARNTGK